VAPTAILVNATGGKRDAQLADTDARRRPLDSDRPIDASQGAASPCSEDIAAVTGYFI
jgi:hypothetical protein